MDAQTIGLIFAIIGLITTIGYFIFAYRGLNLLEEFLDYKKQDKKTENDNAEAS